MKPIKDLVPELGRLRTPKKAMQDKPPKRRHAQRKRHRRSWLYSRPEAGRWYWWLLLAAAWLLLLLAGAATWAAYGIRDWPAVAAFGGLTLVMLVPTAYNSFKYHSGNFRRFRQMFGQRRRK